jgi:molecular chaperone GrpE (heat shock protein)
MLHDDSSQVMDHAWKVPTTHTDKARRIVAKFKNLRRVLRAWQKQLSNLATTITNNKRILLLLDTLEEFRDQSLQEWNFRVMVQNNLEGLLEQQMVYWKQRGIIKLAELGDENTKNSHDTATIQHNKNTIMSLTSPAGIQLTNHEEKASLL